MLRNLLARKAALQRTLHPLTAAAVANLEEDLAIPRLREGAAVGAELDLEHRAVLVVKAPQEGAQLMPGILLRHPEIGEVLCSKVEVVVHLHVAVVVW